MRAVSCFCKHCILSNVTAVAASTVPYLFSGLQQEACINLRTELSSLAATGIWQCFLKTDHLLGKEYEHKCRFSL